MVKANKNIKQVIVEKLSMGSRDQNQVKPH